MGFMKGLLIFLLIITLIMFVAIVAFFVFRTKTLNTLGEQTSLTTLYHSQLDNIAPDYLDNRAINCAAASGDWKDDDTAVGCFNIEIPWDASNCNSAQVIILKNICVGVANTNWVCDTNGVGCYYG